MRLICVTGPDGSGKSTLIADLATRLRSDSAVRAREVSVWDLIRAPDVQAVQSSGVTLPSAGQDHRPSFPIDPRRIDDYLGMLVPLARAHFLLHCWAEALERALRSDADVLLINAYWYKYLATEVIYGASEAVLEALTAGLPEPDLVMYLDVPVATAAARKDGPAGTTGRFSGYESGFPGNRDVQAFTAFQAKIQPVLVRWCAEREWTRLDGSCAADDVLEAAWQRLQPYLSTETSKY